MMRRINNMVVLYWVILIITVIAILAFCGYGLTFALAVYLSVEPGWMAEDVRYDIDEIRETRRAAYFLGVFVLVITVGLFVADFGLLLPWLRTVLC